MDSEQFDELVYSESRTINIGDYESRSIFFSLKTRVKKIDKHNNTITIKDYEKCSTEEFEGDVNKTFIHTKNLVRGRLDIEERKIRKWAQDFLITDLRVKLENPPK
jgi:hypothetical protein